ncbi:MAG TPA: MSHA biogenesis protein MshI [Paucimonas sp.]|nr:MSHA biogenesis protein MshI [Paucimonas sp.]
MSQQINLFNPIFLKQKKHFSSATMVQALAAILVGAILMVAYAGYRTNVLKKEAAVAQEQRDQAQAQLAQVLASSVPRQKSKALEENIRKVEAEVKALRQAFDTLQSSDLGNKKGYSEYFRAFSRQILPGLWLTGFSIHGAGNEIGIQGRTLKPELVPEYLNRLKHESSMAGKSFATLEMLRPVVEQSNGSNPAPGVQPASRQSVAAAYMEFKLLSSGMPADKSDASGAKTK